MQSTKSPHISKRYKNHLTIYMHNIHYTQETIKFLIKKKLLKYEKVTHLIIDQQFQSLLTSQASLTLNKALKSFATFIKYFQILKHIKITINTPIEGVILKRLTGYDDLMRILSHLRLDIINIGVDTLLERNICIDEKQFDKGIYEENLNILALKKLLMKDTKSSNSNHVLDIVLKEAFKQQSLKILRIVIIKEKRLKIFKKLNEIGIMNNIQELLVEISTSSIFSYQEDFLKFLTNLKLKKLSIDIVIDIDIDEEQQSISSSNSDLIDFCLYTSSTFTFGLIHVLSELEYLEELILTLENVDLTYTKQIIFNDESQRKSFFPNLKHLALDHTTYKRTDFFFYDYVITTYKINLKKLDYLHLSESHFNYDHKKSQFLKFLYQCPQLIELSIFLECKGDLTDLIKDLNIHLKKLNLLRKFDFGSLNLKAYINVKEYNMIMKTLLSNQNIENINFAAFPQKNQIITEFIKENRSIKELCISFHSDNLVCNVIKQFEKLIDNIRAKLVNLEVLKIILSYNDNLRLIEDISQKKKYYFRILEVSGLYQRENNEIDTLT